MATAKEELTRLIEGQPEDSSQEEIVREMAFHLMVCNAGLLTPTPNAASPMTS